MEAIDSLDVPSYLAPKKLLFIKYNSSFELKYLNLELFHILLLVFEF